MKNWFLKLNLKASSVSSPVSLPPSKLPVDSFTILGTAPGLEGSVTATALSTEPAMSPPGYKGTQSTDQYGENGVSESVVWNGGSFSHHYAVLWGLQRQGQLYVKALPAPGVTHPWSRSLGQTAFLQDHKSSDNSRSQPQKYIRKMSFLTLMQTS